jgi:hypothetical protein
MTPQEQQLLDYLRAGNTITPLESISVLGILALSQRAGSLRRAGFPVVAERIRTPSGKHIARYRLA